MRKIGAEPRPWLNWSSIVKKSSIPIKEEEEYNSSLQSLRSSSVGS